MDKQIIKEVIQEMLKSGELNLEVEVTDGSEIYFMENGEQAVRVKVTISDESHNELTSASDRLTLRNR